MFGRILDDAAGHWSIRPAEGMPFESTRRYVDDTMLLETTFTTASGSVMLTDALAVGRNDRGHELGAAAVSTVELMGLLVQFDLDVVLTGHELWGAYEQVPSLMVYDLLRRPPLEGVSAYAARWDGLAMAEA